MVGTVHRTSCGGQEWSGGAPYDPGMSQEGEKGSERDLLVIDEICRLKYRYLRDLDLKQWDDLAACFTEDATASYGGGQYEFAGRQEIMHFLVESLGPTFVTMHQCHHPEIAVDGDAATGRWALQDTVLMTEHKLVLQGAAFYEDRYVRTDGAWRISHTGYVRTFEYMVSLDDLPSFRLTANRWAATT
jgi:SnoaL-like protein